MFDLFKFPGYYDEQIKYYTFHNIILYYNITQNTDSGIITPINTSYNPQNPC